MPLAHPMLFTYSMKTRLGIILGTLLFSSAAFAGNANTTSPDFVAASPRRHIDRSLVASPDARTQPDPYDVVPFQLDSAALTDAGVDEVAIAARWLHSHPRHKLVLEGHTDALGSFPYNEDLATRRMEVVRQYLMRWGIGSDRIVMLTYGESDAMDLDNPLFPADRRVVMYATKLSPQAVVAMVKESRPALVATWTERGALMRVDHHLTQPTKTVPTTTVRR
jgi:outer membrane protein OmpA-like peptidoglycan-associated protein